MRIQQKLHHYFEYLQQHKKASRFCSVGVAVVLGLLFLGCSIGLNVPGAYAYSTCASGDRAYVVVSGDTLSLIGTRYGVSWQRLASYNRIPNPNLIYVHQVVCIPAHGTSGTVSYSSYTAPRTSYQGSVPSRSTGTASYGTGNVFPYPACTWWANQRYYQVHGVFVPWRTQSEAYQWTARAYQFGWHVSSWPVAGSIVDLQPWVQGAYGGGHVAFVERVLGNGSFVASNMSWGAYPTSVTYVQFHAGPGVTFIYR